MTTLAIGDHVTVDGWRGIAFYVHAEHMEHRYDEEPFLWCDEDHEHDDGCYSWDEEGCDVPTGELDVVMVGDDRVFVVDPADCTPLADEAYCSECGQIGCKADGR